MKFNWGTGIFLFLGLFITTLIIVLIKSFERDNSLVTDDYYYYDIHYQELMDKKRNYYTLENKIIISQKDGLNKVTIIFPDITKGTWTGKLLMYRPSEKNLDKTYPIVYNNDGKMYIDVEKFPSGLWKLQLDITKNQTDYYLEQTITLP